MDAARRRTPLGELRLVRTERDRIAQRLRATRGSLREIRSMVDNPDLPPATALGAIRAIIAREASTW